jgi:hypothetical protein
MSDDNQHEANQCCSEIAESTGVVRGILQSNEFFQFKDVIIPRYMFLYVQRDEIDNTVIVLNDNNIDHQRTRLKTGNTFDEVKEIIK